MDLRGRGCGLSILERVHAESLDAHTSNLAQRIHHITPMTLAQNDGVAFNFNRAFKARP